MPYDAAADRYERLDYRRCGRSGLKLPAISLGLWQNFGGGDVFETGRAVLRRAFDRAKRTGGKTGEALIQDLESRLDATVLRAGFARTIYQARQFVTHKHVLVNGKRVDRPSYRLRPGDFVQVAEKSKTKEPFASMKPYVT